MSRGALVGRGAIVTGGGRGIGEAIADILAEEGASVVVDARTGEEIDRVAAQLRERGRSAWAVRCDVTDEASVKTLYQEARNRLGTVDVLVNNAGVSGSAPVAKISLEDWNRMLAVNATGTFLCTREVLPEMVDRGWGRIVNLASIAGLEGARYVAHYSAAKHAVVGFTRSIALELEGTGVTANAVCPGYVDTPMTERTLANVQSRVGLARDRALAAVLATTGQDRLVTVEEVARAVLELCREAASGVNGRAIVLGAARSPA